MSSELNKAIFAGVRKKFLPLANSLELHENGHFEIIVSQLDTKELIYLGKWVKKRNYKIQISSWHNTLFISILIYK